MLKYQQQMKHKTNQKHSIQPNIFYCKQNQHISIMLMAWVGLGWPWLDLAGYVLAWVGFGWAWAGPWLGLGWTLAGLAGPGLGWPGLT